MVTVIKSEWHQVEKRYAAEIDIDFLSEVYPDKEDSELEVILQGLQDGTYTIDDLMQDDKHPKNVSMAKLVGVERSFVLFEEHMQALIEQLKFLKLYTPSFAKMTDMLIQSTRALRQA